MLRSGENLFRYNRAVGSDYYRFLVPRLDGADIRRRFREYRALVRKGVAGFIVFGGRLETVRRHLAMLQNESELPLVIGSDLERGLGQQLRGGTLFPPAMAVAEAVKKAGGGFDRGLFEAYCAAIAEEAAYAGINTVFAPVMDVNTDPRNPIIAARAFGEDTETVASLGTAMIRAFRSRGVVACAKHFPGHGDTRTDSHIMLPLISKTLRELRQVELAPFSAAVAARVPMIMLGHLKVPALDRTGTPVSLSRPAVRFLRERMGFSGLLITDALNMGGIGRFSEEEAAFRSLSAGVDLILHPTDADRICAYLDAREAALSGRKLAIFRERLGEPRRRNAPDFGGNRRCASLITDRSLRKTGRISADAPLFLMIVTDDPGERGAVFSARLGRFARVAGTRIIRAGKDVPAPDEIPAGCLVVAAVFSETRAWKGGAGGWIRAALGVLRSRRGIAVSFGSPYLLNSVPAPVPRIVAFADSARAEAAAADMIAGRGGARPPADERDGTV
ncbi:MAG: glycoside hydrolase family 3 N-terminal domain-containing protein [Thermodesulfovibrionales bacterium]